MCTPSERETIWAAVSRAVRTPNRFDEGLTFRQFQGVDPGLGLPVFSQINGDLNGVSEDLLAFELGYRAQPVDRFSMDLATFYNHYTDLGTPLAPGVPFFDPTIPGLIVPVTLGNGLLADTYGAELATTYEVREDWRLIGAYTLLYMDVHTTSTTDYQQGSSPINQANLRSSWNLRPDLDLDVIGRYVDNLPALGVQSYCVMDVRLGWRPADNFEWAVVGRNLFDSPHAEFVDRLSGLVGTEVQAEMFTTLTWNY
jgi:iron complex outermembrane receptor protein